MELHDSQSPVRTISPDAIAKPRIKGMALCLSGGGYRAMVFHLGSLWRLNEIGALSRIKRISSVSGGSITAGVLGMNWKKLAVDPATGVAKKFNEFVVDPILGLANRTIDEGSVIGGILLPGTISDKVDSSYNKRLFNDAKLSDLPSDAEGPRFKINATNVQTGSLWRFSKPYMGDYQIGLIQNPDVTLAKAVAASSAFPPVLSPCLLDVDPEDFDRTTTAAWYKPPFNDEIMLTDGGVYDNLGLETAFKRISTIFVSDAGQAMAKEAQPEGDWARHSMRVVNLIDNQVRSLRKRQLIDAYIRKERNGAYWGIGSHFADYKISDPLNIGGIDTSKLAAIKTRLKRMPPEEQERLINWGYAICDAAR
ncbi:MAG: patatin-like phospholipase family protein [Planctomycetes bacterium]|nr:patatin-like phospholipase family protein [Planctomycetota bacterium]